MYALTNIFNQKSILFISPDNRFISQMTFMIKEEGYVHFYANEIKEAQKIILRESPDLVLVSWDFHKTIENLRGLCQQPYSPIMVIADEGTLNKDIYQVLEAGADDYLKRPLDRYKLLAKIHLGLRLSKAMRFMNTRIKPEDRSLRLVSGVGLEARDLDTRMSCMNYWNERFS